MGYFREKNMSTKMKEQRRKNISAGEKKYYKTHSAYNKGIRPSDAQILKSSTNNKITWKLKNDMLLFEELNYRRKRERLMEKQNCLCAVCNIKPVWNDRILTFQLHHKDGDRKNGKEENCQMLCPNCHSQTETYAGNKTNISEELRSKAASGGKIMWNNINSRRKKEYFFTIQNIGGES
jgi:hypothetical protein